MKATPPARVIALVVLAEMVHHAIDIGFTPHFIGLEGVLMCHDWSLRSMLALTLCRMIRKGLLCRSIILAWHRRESGTQVLLQLRERVPLQS